MLYKEYIGRYIYHVLLFCFFILHLLLHLQTSIKQILYVLKLWVHCLSNATLCCSVIHIYYGYVHQSS